MLPVSVLHILDIQSACIYGVAIVMTIIALAISTRFSLRNLLNIHVVDDHLYALGAKCGLGDASPCDATGSDGDDEADPDGEEDAATDVVTDSQQVFSNCDKQLQCYEYIQSEMEQIHPSLATEVIEKSFTQPEVMEEGKQRQLKEIFRLMQQQKGQFGVRNKDSEQ